MKIKLMDQTTHDIERAEVIDGRLEIDFKDKTTEEVQELFSESANLTTIELLTDDENVFSILTGWVKYGGVMLNGETKTAILSQAVDEVEQRITSAEAAAISAKLAIEEQKEKMDENAEQITDLQLAIVEIYEGLASDV